MAQTLTLSISEQPAKLHRFRYLKEIKGNRMGSILHSQSSFKTPVKVRVTASLQSLSSECQMKLIGCTVFEDQSPHPFYLFGDDCREGCFQKEFSIRAGKSECEVSLDRIGIVCTPKKRKSPAKGKVENGAEESAQNPKEDNYQWRLTELNFFNRPLKTNPLQGKDVNKLRLAFQVFVCTPANSQTWVPGSCDPVATDVISDAKIYSSMTVDYMNPKAVSRRDEDVWLYMKDPLPVESAARYKVILEGSDMSQEMSGLELPVTRVKKHLIVFNLSSLPTLRENLSFSVKVVDTETGESSEPVENFQVRFSASDFAEPASKKERRVERENVESVDDLLEDILDEFAPLQPFAMTVI